MLRGTVRVPEDEQQEDANEESTERPGSKGDPAGFPATAPFAPFVFSQFAPFAAALAPFAAPFAAAQFVAAAAVLGLAVRFPLLPPPPPPPPPVKKEE